MKIFTPENSFPDKVNFVDKNNSFVGFEIGGRCCETYGWFVARKIPMTKEEFKNQYEINPNPTLGYENYTFDCELAIPEGYDKVFDNESLSYAVFSLSEPHPNYNKIYLIIFNEQNGCYSHGFEFNIHDELKGEGKL